MTTILGYVLGGLIILVSALIVVLVLFQDSKKRGLSGAIGGTSSDSFFGKNQGQTKEKKLARYTTISAVVFAVLTIAAYLLVL
jgi:preprotein translocase subunit SecG